MENYRASVRLRPHHINMFIDDNGSLRERVSFQPFLEAAYGKDFVKSLENIMDQATIDTSVEIVSGQDELCSYCPHSELCKAGDFEALKKRLSNNLPPYLSQYIDELLNRNNPEISDETCLRDYGLKIGQTYKIKELCVLRKKSYDNIKT